MRYRDQPGEQWDWRLAAGALTLSTLKCTPLLLLVALSQCAAPGSWQTRILQSEHEPASLTASSRTQTPDGDLVTAVKLSLHRAPGASTAVQVTATEGVVELSGATRTVLGRRRAIAVAQSIKGVRAVVDLLTLEIPQLPDDHLVKEVTTAPESR